MLNFSSHLQWFQAKIGSYDKQIWETSVEQRILQGLENRPKRQGSLNKELIDLDLVRGSTFSKAKPRHGLKSVIFNGLKRVTFFPYYFNQWRDHFNKEVVYLFLFHYVIQLIQLILYFIWSNSSEFMVEEIFLPIVLALSLGVLHAHIIAPYTVKRRRKKTIGVSSSKIKSVSKSESKATVTDTSVVSRQQSLQLPATTQLSDSSQQSPKDPWKNDIFHTCQESHVSNITKRKSVLFKKLSSQEDDVSDNRTATNADQMIVQQEEYDGETETKDSSSSDHEDLPGKNIEEDISMGTKGNDDNDPSCTEVVSNAPVTKVVVKRLKLSDSPESCTPSNKIKINTRRFSQTDGIKVTDEDDLKKFITAKNKLIPDPTPINNLKKDKDKSTWKAINGNSQKSYKSSKSRRQTLDWIDHNSGSASSGTEMCNCALVVSDNSKNNKSTVTESTISSSSMVDTGTIVPPNGNVICQDNLPGDSPDYKPSSSMGTGETVVVADMIPLETTEKTSQSQPHTPVIHAGNKYRHRIEVRKVSSADASPTPSRKNSTLFVIPATLHRDLRLDPMPDTIELNHTNLQQNSVSCLLEHHNTFLDNSISSEDHSSRVLDNNEDTITKSNKKREEFKQLFVQKARASLNEKGTSCNSTSKSISSTSSSRKSVTDTKHGKVKRKHRDECILANVDTFKKAKHRKETFQSMSETEYERMNSDVNSTGNSTSDAEDICPNVATVTTANDEVLVSKKEIADENNAVEIGVCVGDPCNNDNNDIVEDITSRPVPSGDVLPPDVATDDDPFVLWYKEAHNPGSLYGMSGSVSCYIWENDELKKTSLSLLDIGWSIIQAVERHEQDKSYSTIAFITIMVLCFTPIFFRMYINRAYLSTIVHMSRHSNIMDIFLITNGTFIHSIMAAIKTSTPISVVTNSLSNSSSNNHVYSWSGDIIPLTLTSIMASEWPIRFIVILGVILRLVLYTLTFLLLCVAENSFEQRLQYAKNFCRLTSSRRARKYYLPHFRLNKLANIKCWLSLRSYLKKRGPQRSVDSIISSVFYMLLAMLSLVCVNLLQSTDNHFINRLINWDMMLCSIALGVFMMRFLVLGTKITKKYRNLSVIITEQINLFLAMQTRPHKKEELQLAHNVLRLAESLLKEVEGPFRICGWSMNPFLYNILKVVILSVFSTVLSETCGFKMKLYKIKINPANW